MSYCRECLHDEVCSLTHCGQSIACCNFVNAKRYHEIMHAEREGRLVIPPCKTGDTVWTNFAMTGWYFRKKDRPYSAKVVFVGLNGSEDMGGGFFNILCGKNEHMMQFRFSDLGKTVFLSRAEAEKALEEANG